MNAKDSFKDFANRVVHALRGGGLPGKDLRTVKRLLLKTEKKNLILSRALLTAFAGGEQSENDVTMFANLLDVANRRIMEDREPFSAEEKKELEEIFKRHSVSAKAARKFALGMDELLVMELKTQMGRKPEVLLKKQQESSGQAERKEEREKLVH